MLSSLNSHFEYYDMYAYFYSFSLFNVVIEFSKQVSDFFLNSYLLLLKNLISTWNIMTVFYPFFPNLNYND